jgi:3-phosphoshikimate 1-carboxyvinyltransferase
MTTFAVEGGASLHGTLRLPGDKSISHRALLLAAATPGESRVTGLSTGDDVRRTAAAVSAMGAVVDGDRIIGGGLYEPTHVLDVGNSGTGIRLLAGFCAAYPWMTLLSGDASVNQRPMDRITEPLREMGAWVDGRDRGRYAPLAVRGGSLRGIDYQVPMVSAQVKSAILLAGLGAEGDTIVRERVRTRAHTEELFALAGADIEVSDDGHTVRVRRSELRRFQLDVPGDPSQAAFWVVAACVLPDSELVLERVYDGPARSGFIDVLRRMGASIDVDRIDSTTVTITARTSSLVGTEIDGDELPSLDEVPAIAVAAALADGTTVITNAAELRVKETDRIETVADNLGRLGCAVDTAPDGLTITGGRPLAGATVDSFGDHRIAMAMAVAGLAASGTTYIEGWDAVATSYPGFEEDLAACR